MVHCDKAGIIDGSGVRDVSLATCFMVGKQVIVNGFMQNVEHFKQQAQHNIGSLWKYVF